MRPLRGSANELTFFVIDAHWMAVARGDEPADLVLSGGHVFSVFTKEWLDVDVAVQDGFVMGLGHYQGRDRLDVEGAYLVPGFIDAHMHIESSKLMRSEEHTSELQSHVNLVCRLLLEKKKK